MEKSEQTEPQDDSALRPKPLGIDAHLRFVCAELRGQAMRLPASGLTLGRAPAVGPRGLRGDELLLGDGRMSRPHARIEPISLGWQLVDLGSTNRGFVEGRAFGARDRVDLVEGTLVRLGDTLFVFRIGPPPPPAPPADAEPGVFPGDSPVACAVRDRIRELSAGAGHVLIVGETGTGKERVARALGAPGRPFVPQNCAELTRDLARSELFGHVRGAFSGAHAAKSGLVEVADEGTLFLDELGELALDVQADLLRFLEDGKYRPLGAIELRHSSARVVAATNVDLNEAVWSGRFRRDLRARMRASNEPLELPPLRDRCEDIPGWVQRFATEAGSAIDPGRWSPGAVECLLLYPWPENLRELRGVVRGLPAASDRAIQPDDLPERIPDHRRKLRASTQPPSTPPPSTPPPVRNPPSTPPPAHTPPDTPAPDAAASPPASPPGVPLGPGPTSAREPTRDEIEATLTSSGGSMREAAKMLQVERTKLYRLCRSFGIDLDRFRGVPEQED